MKPFNFFYVKMFAEVNCDETVSVYKKGKYI